MGQFEDRIVLQDIGQAQQIGGLADENIRIIEKATGARLVARGQDILLSGSQPSVKSARAILEYLIELSLKKELTPADLQYALTLGSSKQENDKIAECLGEVIHTTHRGKQIRAKTMGQYKYVKAIEKKDITNENKVKLDQALEKIELLLYPYLEGSDIVFKDTFDADDAATKYESHVSVTGDRRSGYW